MVNRVRVVGRACRHAPDWTVRSTRPAFPGAPTRSGRRNSRIVTCESEGEKSMGCPAGRVKFFLCDSYRYSKYGGPGRVRLCPAGCSADAGGLVRLLVRGRVGR